MQLFQRTLLCSWDFGIGDPLLYVGLESTATGKASSASRSISSHSVKTVKYRGRSSLPSLVTCKAMMSMPYLTVSSLSSTTVVVKQSQFHCRIVRRCLFCSGISVMRSTAAGWLVALCTDMASPCICRTQSLQSQLGFPGTLHMELLPACYADERTSNLS